MVEAKTPNQILHLPVLLNEVVLNLFGKGLPKRRVVVDCTLGMGGHAKMMAIEMAKNGKLIGFDLDLEHIKIAKKNLKNFKDQVIFVNANFSTLKHQLEQLKIKGIDAILFDLGMASTHVDDPEKGFSFLREGPLDMRFDKNQQLTAAEVVNKYSEKELIRIFKEYGEEKKARKVVLEIVARRKRHPFKTTTELAGFIEKILKRQGRIHPATRIFQALRIEVNHELDVLAEALNQTVGMLRPQGRVAVISYHSLEDRIVKRFFREMALDYMNEEGKMTTTKLDPQLKIITKKPLMATMEEVVRNPRSRSAKLRVAEKL